MTAVFLRTLMISLLILTIVLLASRLGARSRSPTAAPLEARGIQADCGNGLVHRSQHTTDSRPWTCIPATRPTFSTANTTFASEAAGLLFPGLPGRRHLLIGINATIHMCGARPGLSEILASRWARTEARKMAIHKTYAPVPESSATSNGQQPTIRERNEARYCTWHVAGAPSATQSWTSQRICHLGRRVCLFKEVEGEASWASIQIWTKQTGQPWKLDCEHDCLKYRLKHEVTGSEFQRVLICFPASGPQASLGQW